MPRPGGEADKLGNQYEAIWTVDAVLNVFLGKAMSITVEAFGEGSEGVEFHLETPDKKIQFHSVKRQKQGGDWSVADLCRANVSTGRSILGDLFNKRRTYNNAQLRFVSATGANQLRELSERAETPTTLAEFRAAISGSRDLQAAFADRIVPLCSGEEEFAFRSLKALEVVLTSQKELTRRVEQRIEILFYRKNRSNLAPDEFRRTIAEFVLENLGPTLNTERIRAFVNSEGIGIRDWKADATVNDAVNKINHRYLAITETELINSAQIIRNESGQIIDVLFNPVSRGALLVAPGGYGKSCVLAQVLSRLAVQDVPFIVVRMDSLQVCSTSRQLGQQLDLLASPAIVLAGIADHSPCVLVVDQLDAMSLVSGRNPQMWDVFQELCEDVQPYPNMKMVLACRDFDLDHDYRLRRLGDSQSGFTRITLGKLTQTDIKKSLATAGLDELTLNNRQLEILGVPFHLNFARDEAVELFLKACEGYTAICGTPPFERFIHYAVYTHYPQLREILQFALGSDNADAVENAARQIALADLDEIDVGSDASNIRHGTETMRKAAATVYASNLAHERVGNKCAEHLEEFFNDDSEKVRQEVSSSFFGLSGARLLELESVIGQFIESKSFEHETDRLLHALEESNVELPQIICRAAERVLEFLDDEGTHHASHGAMVAQSISKLIVRQYEQSTDATMKKHCLDLIDQMERVGYLGIGDELNRIDR